MERFAAKVRAKVPEFIDMLVPLYDRYLTMDDVTEMIELYRSPLGRRLVDLQLVLASEMEEIGQRWGTAMAGEVLQEMARKP